MNILFKKECCNNAMNSKKITLINSDPGKVMNLVTNLTDDHCAQLQIKINNYFKEECDAELVLMVEVQTERMEASVQAIGDVALPRKQKLLLPQTFINCLKSNVDVSELLSNCGSEFLQLVEPYVFKNNERKRVIATPVPSTPFSVLVCVIAPKVSEHRVATLVQECFTFIWPVLKKGISLDYERTLKQKCQLLLRVARHLFTQVASLDTLLKLVMDRAKLLTRAQYCSVFLVDVETMELVEKYYEGKTKDNNETHERRFPMKIGITGQALSTGYLVNVKDVKTHSAFDATIDQRPGIETKTMLCFPVRDQSGIVGVGQLINKVGEPYFDAMDEESALAFSIYCGVCIVHSVVYQKIQEAHIRNALANELVMYHMKVSDMEVSRVAECQGFHLHPHTAALDFNTRALPPRELPCYVVKMFTDLGFVQKFHIKLPKLIRFVLHVKKAYRDVPYHNWGHGFNVCQWAYAAIINYKLIENGYLTDLQAFIYLLAALVHDVDHRGTTNNFQLQRQTMLAALYSNEGSVLERHHLAQAICMLNTQGCDILESLPRHDYDRALLMLRDYILASDLTNYFKNLDSYRTLAPDFVKGNRVHTTALQALLMNASDLSDQVKDWGVVKKSAVSLLTEFFHQGDVEKSRGNTPATIMDREKCFIPDMEIQFLNNVCKPLYSTLALMIPKVQKCCMTIDSHLERWEAAKSAFAEVAIKDGLSVLLSDELDDKIEINLKKNREDTEETNES